MPTSPTSKTSAVTSQTGAPTSPTPDQNAFYSRAPAPHLSSLPISPFSQSVDRRQPVSTTTYGALTPLTPLASSQPLAAHFAVQSEDSIQAARSSPGQRNSPPSTSTTLSYPLGSDAGEAYRMRSLPKTARMAPRLATMRDETTSSTALESGTLGGADEVHVSLSGDGRPVVGGKKATEATADSLDYVVEDMFGGEGSLKTSTIGDDGEPEDEDSPYLEVRASVSNIDDPDMPVLTFRLWTMGLGMCIISAALNTFFNFRYPSPYISPSLILLLSYPIGKIMAYALPMRAYQAPKWLGGWEFTLNPGPFNVKEHALILIMANVAVAPPYSMNVIVTSEMYYSANFGVGFNFLIVLATQLTGFGFAGLCRRFLVWPASMIWPQNLVASTLLNTLHAEEDLGDSGQGVSRYKLFMIAGAAAFFWYFVPGYLFNALSYFSWVCWIWPNNVVVNQLFGTVSGLGMGVITFDWTQIAYIASPLMMPWWAELHTGIGFLLSVWVLAPALYYSNIWNFPYLPMLSPFSYDKFGQVYNVSMVVNDQMQFDLEKYNLYSPVWLPCTFAVLYIFSFALSTAAISHTILHHGATVWNGIRRVNVEKEDIHYKLMKRYPEVPHWWYAVFAVFFWLLAIVAAYVWPTELPFWGLMLSILVPIVYLIPAGFIYALTGLGLGINLVSESIAGVLLSGKPVANMIFKAYSLETLENTLAFVQDLKLGHYIKIPPRATFVAQVVATFLAALIQVGVKTWLFSAVPDICQPTQAHNLTCPRNSVFFTASVLWGLIGPIRQFGPSSPYYPMVWSALVFGTLAPLPFWLLARKYPDSFWKSVNIPVLLIAPTLLPPATGINYSSWFVVGFIFQYVIRRRFFQWWTKYNYILSSALDSGTIISTILIFFILQFPKNGTLVLEWWGNTVSFETLDASETLPRLYQIPPEGLS
ncbi:OPT-domain-containing protein [Dacryopinax primogenitus]|uniref:OPT-domain-containing protein n=1 Tax=Dacryopinax primogenitus (strain DJM 731) TaxID=1858805 RepID=M5G2F3_DACPD|nr:OPT-domain-containing protein [Dacryopinax primogenitus]EJT97947.1 OPT-domain-containing protein [Dacryopinax primogenitus]